MIADGKGECRSLLACMSAKGAVYKILYIKYIKAYLAFTL